MSEDEKKTEEQQDVAGAEPEEQAAEEPVAEPTPEEKIAELEHRYQRAVADLQNAQKRFIRERERTSRMAVASFVAKLLPMVDNMAHSLKSASDAHDAAQLIEGFGLIEAQLFQIFKESGIQPIESVGKPFDPEFHHAVTTEVTDEFPPGTVTAELGRGFMIGDFVVRPAQVRVAAAPPEQDEQDDLE